MITRRSHLAAVIVFLAIYTPAVSLAQGNPQPDPLTVMTFNIRYGTARDGDNQWSARRELLFDVVREANADLVGLQEALSFQIDEILAAAPSYAAIGIGRDDAVKAGEHSAILFRRDRFRVADSGTFWFSDTPSVPASRTWGNNVTRICTWARFIDRDGRAFYLFNVHLDHESQPSRERSTALLRQRIEAREFRGEPVVLTGDFNAGEGNPALATLTGTGGEAGGLFRDTFRVLHPAEKSVGTANNFLPDRTAGDKIDYVFVQPGTEVLSAAIIHTSRNNRVPSDHFPVIARIRLAAVPSK
jgi:endonuclease/exonuclease/phosphatase family metal-dependent hydrolase